MMAQMNMGGAGGAGGMPDMSAFAGGAADDNDDSDDDGKHSNDVARWARLMACEIDIPDLE